MMKDGKISAWISLWSFRRRYSTAVAKTLMNATVVAWIVSIVFLALDVSVSIKSGFWKMCLRMAWILPAFATVFSWIKDAVSFFRAFRLQGQYLTRYSERTDKERTTEVDDRVMNAVGSVFETRNGAKRIDFQRFHDFIFYYPEITNMLLNECEIHGFEIRERDSGVWQRINERLADSIDAIAMRKQATEYRKFFNENKIILTSEPVLSKADNRIVFSYAKSCYYASYLTTEFYRDVEYKNGHRKNHAEWKPFMTSGNNWALPNFDGEVSLHFGVNTLAITSDGYVLVWKQGRGNNRSENLATPSGSGSMDFEDIDEACPSFVDGKYKDFRLVIRHSAERELCEEMFKRRVHANFLMRVRRSCVRLVAKLPLLRSFVERNSIKMDTKIIGMFRWGAFGGLPGFVCITKLNSTLNKVRRQINLSEGDLDESLYALRLGRGKGEDIQAISEYSIMREKDIPMSIPLRASVVVLSDAISMSDAFYKWLCADCELALRA